MECAICYTQIRFISFYVTINLFACSSAQHLCYCCRSVCLHVGVGGRDRGRPAHHHKSRRAGSVRWPRPHRPTARDDGRQRCRGGCDQHRLAGRPPPALYLSYWPGGVAMASAAGQQRRCNRAPATYAGAHEFGFYHGP